MVGSNSEISIRTGFNPALITANAVEQYVIAGIITSESFGRFKIFNAIVKASVPFAQLIAYFVPQKFAKAFSNLLTKLPSIKSLLFITFLIFLKIVY